MHPGIPQARERIKEVAHRSLKGFPEAVDKVREVEKKVAHLKAEREMNDSKYQHGLVTAHTGSVYDVPTIADDSTKASENGDSNSYFN